MFDNINNNNDNTILIDVNSRRQKKQKILCVLCRIQLDCVNPEENRYKCPRCKNSYQLGYEIIPQEDELESSHSEYEDFEEARANLLVADDDDYFDDNDDYDRTNSDIPIPKYMKSSATTEVIEYREE